MLKNNRTRRFPRNKSQRADKTLTLKSPSSLLSLTRMAAIAKEEEPSSSNEHTPPPSPSPNKRNNPKDLLLSNCHSCDQTLTHLQTLASQWRIVLLCNDCINLIKSVAKCSYCFFDFSDGRVRFLDCRQCSSRVHFDCILTEQRYISPSLLDPDSFICVDCCAVRTFGNRNSRSLFTRASVEELMMVAKNKADDAARAKEKALEKVMAAKLAADRAREKLAALFVDPVVKDEELALRLHLAMNGSQRISRSGRRMNLKKAKGSNGCLRSCEKVGFCKEDTCFFDSWNPSVELGLVERKGLKKEQGGCSDNAVDFGDDNSTLAVWITCHRANKLSGLGLREKSSNMKQKLNGVSGGINSSMLEQKSKCNTSGRYEKKFNKRKSGLKEVLNIENGLVPCGR